MAVFLKPQHSRHIYNKLPRPTLCPYHTKLLAMHAVQSNHDILMSSSLLHLLVFALLFFSRCPLQGWDGKGVVYLLRDFSTKLSMHDTTRTCIDPQ